MLNRPFGEEDGNDERKGLYRVHRHTLPACIPLASLAKRWLPNGKGVVGSGLQGGKRQDMKGFVRAVRRELVGYHKRIAVIKGLRTSFDLDEPTTSSNQKRMEKRMEKGREKVIVDITPADAEAKQVRIEWRDGRIGRVQMDEEGKMLKCVVIGEEGRDRDIEGRITRRDENGNEARIEELCERLMEGIY
jgi:central kinetochore subunit Mal2/MCM21